ncbi:dihydrodipicolinate synthase family protein, partial [Pseudotabrizicola alkalilacus]
VSETSTREALRFINAAVELGVDGFMLMPSLIYVADAREAMQSIRTMAEAAAKPCMIYNNPIAYKTDFSPAQIAELAQAYPNVQAVKESSGDVRRFAALRSLLGDRLELLVGMDDAIVEGVAMGATGWIAGLVNAYPKESVKLFELARDGGGKAAAELYAWFLPLLRLDTVPKFV